MTIFFLQGVLRQGDVFVKDESAIFYIVIPKQAFRALSKSFPVSHWLQVLALLQLIHPGGQADWY